MQILCTVHSPELYIKVFKYQNHFSAKIRHKWWSEWSDSCFIVFLVLENPNLHTQHAYISILGWNWKFTIISMILGRRAGLKPGFWPKFGLNDGLSDLKPALSCSSFSKTPIYIPNMPIWVQYTIFMEFWTFRQKFPRSKMGVAKKVGSPPVWISKLFSRVKDA